MQPEIEAKFLNVNHDALRKKLKHLNAVREKPLRLMRRKNYDFPDRRLQKKHSWIRLRDEGDKITISYKQLNSRELDGTLEVNFKIDDFDKASEFLEAIGLEAKTYQETQRESWSLPGFEIELDIWPWVKPYVEIEGHNEQSLKDIAKKLGLDWSRVCHGSVEIVYRAEYEVTDDEIDGIPIITFDEPVPDWLQKRCKL